MFFYRSVSLFDQEGGGGKKRKKNPLGIAQKGGFTNFFPAINSP